MLFSARYTAEIKSKLLLNLASMDFPPETSNDLTTLIFLTIIMNHILDTTTDEKNHRIDEWNRKTLASIKGDDEFREKGFIQFVLRAIDMLAVKGVSANLYSEMRYIDGLFGYKSFNRIKESIYEDYGKETGICIEEETLFINATVERLKEFMILPAGSFHDINNYAKFQTNFLRLIVGIEASNVRKGPNPAVKVIYSTFSLPSNSVKQTIVKRNGKTEKHTLRVI